MYVTHEYKLVSEDMKIYIYTQWNSNNEMKYEKKKQHKKKTENKMKNFNEGMYTQRENRHFSSNILLVSQIVSRYSPLQTVASLNTGQTHI